MALLRLRFLGSFQVELDGSAVTGFSTNKARALLAFLATESDRVHRRQTLAGLLWPDYPERSARTSLRSALATIRQAIGDHQADPAFLRVSRQAIGLNCDSDVWVDVTALGHLLDEGHGSRLSIAQLEEAVALYQGEFLEGLSLADSAAFDDWVSIKRVQIRARVMAALDRLVADCHDLGAQQKALRYAQQRVELDPWEEPARRELMRLLAITDHRASALAQYEDCRRLLADDLGVEPEPETTSLYQQICDGRLGEAAAFPGWSMEIRPSPPSFLTESAEVALKEPVFVGREQELGRLRGYLQKALDGREPVIFVTGGAGRGKTVLLEAFARRILSEQPIAVATGFCNAYSGGGDPYLPFRQVLEMLTGDVDDLWAAGRITKEHATRLWALLPVTAQAILEAGPDLIETFLAGRALLERAAAAVGSDAAWLPRLGRLVRARIASREPGDLEQRTLIEQYAAVLEQVARRQPLAIILEDLHWADRGSVELLLHIGRRLANSRILILGAYRPDEIALGHDGRPHPLEEAVAELAGLRGEIEIDLAIEDPAATLQFVSDLLDVEPNKLDDAFRRELHSHTRGHPLFTVETLRMLQEQGDLVRDSEGRWVKGRALAWDRMPARVEAVIQKRVDRLDPLRYECLAVASVEGEELTAEVVAQVLDKPERQVMRILSQDLGRRHRLLRERGETSLGGELVSRFRFSHHLIQHHVYHSLSPGERRELHEEVARALEDLFAHEIEAVTMQLAYHYSRTGVKEKALHFLTEAGHQARKRYDCQQAVEYYTQALSLLAGDSLDRFRLLAARAAAYDTMAQRQAQKADLDAMEALALSLGDGGLQCDALLALSDHYLATKVFRAREPAQRARVLAREIDDGVREAHALRRLSWECRLGADLQTTRTYLTEATARFQEAGLPGEAAGCLLGLARRLPGSGKQVFELDPAEQAMSLSLESGDIRLQARARKHLAIAYSNLGRDAEALPLAEESLETQCDLGDRHEQCSTMDVQGVTLARLGQREESTAMLQRCLALSEEIGSDWGVLGAVFGLWYYWYVPDGEYEQLFAFLDERLEHALANGRHWLVGFLGFLKTEGLIGLGQYDDALALIRTTALPAIAEEDLVSLACTFKEAGLVEAELGRYAQARRDLDHAVELAEETSDRYLLSCPLVELATLARYEGKPDLMRKGLEQTQTAIAATREVHEEMAWARALDVSARLHLALGEPEAAHEVSVQAMQLLESNPWLPMPQAHLFTHFLALRALEREGEAGEHIQRAYERVMSVAGKLTDEPLHRSWLQNVRVNREILGHWNEARA